MKTAKIITVILLINGASYAQETPTNSSELPVVNPAPVENVRAEERKAVRTEVRQNGSAVTISKRPGEAQRTHDLAYYNEEIAKIDAHVNAIDAKIALVNADPTQKAEAQANGWFEDMDRIKSELAVKRADLVTKRDNL